MQLIVRALGFLGAVAAILHIAFLPAAYLTSAPVDGFMLFSAVMGQIFICLIALGFAFPAAKWRWRI